VTTQLPRKGKPHEEILDEMRSFSRQDANYIDGKTWSLVYYLDEEHTEFLKKAHNCFFSENGLNPMAFRSLKRFESEVIRMTAEMLNGDREVVGTLTSGGTESCMLAVKTYRDKARAEKPWIVFPEMVVPESMHVAFYKAADYFKVKLVLAPLTPDKRVDVKELKKRVGVNTIMIGASAPAYPHGVVDPIEEIGAFAKKKSVPFHVDGCLGGFMLPFVEKLGYPVPTFDFRVDGVTSMSADVHKYGFAAKGASTILYRNVDLLKHQMFVYENWPGGIFASPALLGTRPGGSIAAAWAAMMALGKEGYLENAQKAMEATEALIDGVNGIDGLRVIGTPHMTVFAYESTDPWLNIFAVGDQMEKRGWHIDRQQRPDSLHAMVTPRHVGVVDDYLEDLAASVAAVRADPSLAETGGAATYGMISSVPFRGLIKKEVLQMMLDQYGPEGKDLDVSEAKDDLASRAVMFLLKVKHRVARGEVGSAEDDLAATTARAILRAKALLPF
jgi:glutamate/tyrosine decarboxylase-like PLP-dependent enzyme